MAYTSGRLLRFAAGMVAAFLITPHTTWAADTANESDITNRMGDSAKVLNEVMSDPNKAIPKGVIERASCVVVFPSTVQVAVLVGAKHGKGFASCRTSNGWSAPAPVSISGGSWGAQLGGESIDLVIVVTDEKGKQQLESSKFDLGTETSVTAGPVGQHEMKVNADAVTYSRSRGVFAGMNLSGSSINLDQSDTQTLYGKTPSLTEILSGKVQAPSNSHAFLSTVERYAGRTKMQD
jgi:SH3 domain-containing YSC84-like protein 1